MLEYFSSAVQIGLTATPKETEDVSNIDYFGEPIYTYSLRQGIEDGFLAPYKVIRIDLDKDVDGWRPRAGELDRYGTPIPDELYTSRDFDRTLVLDERTKVVAWRVSEYLRQMGRYRKTIIFCEDIEHAERMRHAIANQNGDLVNENRRYVMRITGDNPVGKAELDNFISPEERYPVIATTSKLLNTGVDTQTCHLIVLDRTINSMTEFKQIIGRGTRIREDFGKTYFTIMDFRNVTRLFADPDFDGDPVQIYEPGPHDPTVPPEGEPGDGQDAGDSLPPDLRQQQPSALPIDQSGARSTTSTRWKSRFWPSASSIWIERAICRPSRSATSAARTCARSLPRWTTFSSVGARPTAKRPFWRSWSSRAFCWSSCRLRPRPTWTPST